MNSATYDAIVVGAGSGGLTVAVGLARFGRKVMLAERGPVGGDCTNLGCIPSKTLLSLAATHGTARPSSEILAEVRQRRTELSVAEAEEFGGLDGIDLVSGSARLLGGGRVEVLGPNGDQTVAADNIVLATGSSPLRLDIDGLPSERYFTNETFFEQQEIPKRLVIVGGGAIGLEMAVAANRLGAEVTVIEETRRFLPSIPSEAVSALTETLTEDGIDLRAGTAPKSFVDGGLVIESTDGKSETLAAVDAVLVAVGRMPNSGDLGLDAAGVNADDVGRIVVDGRGRTSADGVWAVGDVTTNGGTTHTAHAWGRRVVEHLLFGAMPTRSAPAEPTVIFTDPEVASLGRQPDVVPRDVMRIRVDLAAEDRGYSEQLRRGLLIVDVRRFSGRIEGVTIIGPRASELLATFSLADKAGVPFHRFYGTVFAYPTYAWAIQQAVDQYVTATVPRLHTQFGQWLRARAGR